MRNLRLAIRHGRRNAVDQHAQAAYAERGSGAKTANRDLQVLGVVLAVVCHDTGKRRERLREVNLQLAALYSTSIDAVDRGGYIPRRLLGTRCCHDHPFERNDRALRGRRLTEKSGAGGATLR